MRIILAASCSFPNGPTGGPRMMSLMARGFGALGHEVLTATMWGTWEGPREMSFGNVHSICARNASREVAEPCGPLQRIRVRIAFLGMLLRILFRRNPDVFVFYGPSVEYLFVHLAIRLFRHCRTCFLSADDYSSCPGSPLKMRVRLALWQFVERTLSRHCSSVLLIGTSLYEARMRRLAPKTPLIRGRGAPTDAAMFSSGDGARFRKKFNIPWKRLVVYCGSIHQFEGCVVLLHAFSALRKKREDVGLVMAGGIARYDAGQGTADYKALTAQLGMTDAVCFTGHVSREDVCDVLAAADVLVSPKIDHPSNRIAFPIKIAEYLASGRPVISSRICEIDQYATDGRQALFIAPGDEKGLTAAMSRILDDPLLAESLGVQGKRLAKEVFDYHGWFAHVAPLVLGTEIP